MILEHVAAILFFSGPLFYIGLWMAVDPAGIATFPRLAVGVFRTVVLALHGTPGPPVEYEQAEIPVKVRRALRCAGVALLLFAFVI